MTKQKRNTPITTGEQDRTAYLMHMDWLRREPDLSSRLSRARLVNLRAKESRWHWIALSIVSVLMMTDFV